MPSFPARYDLENKTYTLRNYKNITMGLVTRGVVGGRMGEIGESDLRVHLS